MFEKTKINEIEAGVGPFFEKGYGSPGLVVTKGEVVSLNPCAI